VSSVVLQRQPRLTVFELDLGNRMIKSLHSLVPVVRFPAAEEEILSTRLLAFSDASFNTMDGELYGQGGNISGLLVRTHTRDAFYFLDQYSSRLKRVVYSSFSAEILACAEADDRLFALRSIFQELHSRTFESELLVDCKGLYSCISSLSNNKGYRLRRTVARIRESFDSGDLDVLRWIRGVLNLADGRTKLNLALWELLHRTMSTGLLQVDVLSAPSRGNGDGWRRDLPQTLHHSNN
jgi:hypothetical protein